MTRSEDLAKLDSDSAWLAQLLAILPRMPIPPEPQIRITKPPAGVAVLACACGRVLDSTEMCRLEHQRQRGDAVLVERIVCAVCANPNLDDRRAAALDAALDQQDRLGLRTWLRP